MDNLGSALAPCDTNAEKKILGALILYPTAIPEIMDKLLPEDFYSTANKEIYSGLCTLSVDGKPISVDTIGSLLSQRKSETGGTVLESIGGARTILECVEGSSTEELDFWTTVVRSKSESRQLLGFAEDARRAALSNSGDVSKLRAKLEERLVSLGGSYSNQSVSINAAADELDERLERYINDPDSIIGLATGWDKLDRSIDGFQPGNVSIFYAPSSRFKSLFTANVGLKFAQNNVPGLWFTTEMPRVQVMERILSLECELNLKWLRRDYKIFDHKQDIYAAKERIKNLPIYFCDTSSVDISEVRAEVSRHKRWNDIQYIIVDLIDHVTSSRYKDEMVNNQRVVMAGMKAIAKDFNIHVILVSHVGKAASQGNTDASLDMENMIGSAAKYQDVDHSFSIMPVKQDMEGKLFALSREEILGKIQADGMLNVLISVTKNRHGELLNYLMTLDFNRGGIFVPMVKKPRPDYRAFVDAAAQGVLTTV